MAHTSNRHATNTHRTLTTAALLVAVLLAAGCTNTDDDTAAPASPTTEAPTTTTEVEPDLDQLEDNWTAAWAAASLSNEAKPAAIEALEVPLGDAAVEGLTNALNGLRDYPSENHPVLDDHGDGTVTINDCVWLNEPDPQGIGKWLRAEASWDPGEMSWTIESVEMVSRDGCVPADLAAEILDDYAEYGEALATVWNPAQPDHPDVARTMTGDHYDLIHELLVEDAARGWYLIDTEQSHPEIFTLVKPTMVRISDCQSFEPGRGLFDADGNQQPGVAEYYDGMRMINEVTMLLEEGQWKVWDIQAAILDTCEFAPTDRGLPLI
jgi:outer membrane murein-binding lipoprotein Lpp